MFPCELCLFDVLVFLDSAVSVYCFIHGLLLDFCSSPVFTPVFCSSLRLTKQELKVSLFVTEPALLLFEHLVFDFLFH